MWFSESAACCMRDFKTRFFEPVVGNTTLKQKTKDYYENGWRLLEELTE
ncbi:MAG TPA: hypothetical protein VNO32_49110 [Candidatus Acidoferrum sp.]|nr:hypothetical protein [Candidatus Acidoferrum sp.]